PSVTVCLQQRSRRAVGRNEYVLVIRLRVRTSSQIDIRASCLRGSNRHRLCRCSGVDVTDKTGDADLAVRAGSNIDPFGLVATQLVHPLGIAVGIILNDESVFGIVGSHLDRTAQTGDGKVMTVLAAKGGRSFEPAGDVRVTGGIKSHLFSDAIQGG